MGVIWERVAEERVATAKEQYVNNPTPNALRAWSEEHQTYRMVRKAENKQLFQR